MKKTFPFAVLVATSLFGCTGMLTGNDTVRSFMPGIYVRSLENEFSSGKDTLLIGVLSTQGNTYRIARRMTYQRIAGGKPLKLERKQEVWTAVYNKQEKALHEIEKGKLISFNPEAKSLMVGTSEYQKIEE